MRGTFYRRARIVVAVVMAAALLAPAYASAACRHWNLNGKWEFWQSNRAKLVVDLKHDLSTGALTGKAQHSGEVEIGGADIPSTWYGTLDGSLNGNKFRFEVVWEENPDLHGQGEYTGEIGPKGELEGATVDLAHPQNKATWHEWAGRRGKCLPFDPNRDIEVTRPKPFDPAPRAGTDFGGSAPATPAQKTATAKDDVDIWDGAGPPGKPFRCGSINCFLSPSDGPQPVLQYNTDGWYRLKTNKVPPGSGWVAEDHLTVK
jgi:hypothetical protein